MKKGLFTKVIFILIAIVFFLPFWILVVQALIPAFDAMLVSMYAESLRLYTNMPVIEQFELLFNKHSNLLDIINRDILWCLSVACIQVMISIISGYLLAKYRSHFTRIIVLMFTMTLVLPMQMFLIPVYRITEWIGVAGNPTFMYLMSAFSPLGAILLRQVFLKMPDEYVESFRLEDSRMNRLVLSVVFPTGLPAASILFLFSFVESWSMVEQPLLLLSDKELFPLSLLLHDMRTQEPDIAYAASLCAFVPVGLLLLAASILGIHAILQRRKNTLIKQIKI